MECFEPPFPPLDGNSKLCPCTFDCTQAMPSWYLRLPVRLICNCVSWNMDIGRSGSRWRSGPCSRPGSCSIPDRTLTVCRRRTECAVTGRSQGELFSSLYWTEPWRCGGLYGIGHQRLLHRVQVTLSVDSMVVKHFHVLVSNCWLKTGIKCCYCSCKFANKTRIYVYVELSTKTIRHLQEIITILLELHVILPFL